MSKTSAAVKNRYMQKAYDILRFTVPKGEKETIAAHAEKMGESTAAFIRRAIENQMLADQRTPSPRHIFRISGSAAVYYSIPDSVVIYAEGARALCFDSSHGLDPLAPLHFIHDGCAGLFPDVLRDVDDDAPLLSDLLARYPDAEPIPLCRIFDGDAVEYYI